VGTPCVPYELGGSGNALRSLRARGECEPASLERHDIPTVPSEQHLHGFSRTGLARNAERSRSHSPSILADARLVSPQKREDATGEGLGFFRYANTV
jgi:hypothetical protein